MSKRSQRGKCQATPDAARQTGQASPSGLIAVIQLWASANARAVWTGVFATVLTGLIVFLYQPALHRVFAGDQLCYLIELDGSQSLWDGLRHYDYPVSRRYDRGDEALYRLCFVWLAVNHWLWQSLLLVERGESRSHLVVVVPCSRCYELFSLR